MPCFGLLRLLVCILGLIIDCGSSFIGFLGRFIRLGSSLLRMLRLCSIGRRFLVIIGFVRLRIVLLGKFLITFRLRLISRSCGLVCRDCRSCRGGELIYARVMGWLLSISVRFFNQLPNSCLVLSDPPVFSLSMLTYTLQ